MQDDIFDLLFHMLASGNTISHRSKKIQVFRNRFNEDSGNYRPYIKTALSFDYIIAGPDDGKSITFFVTRRGFHAFVCEAQIRGYSVIDDKEANYPNPNTFGGGVVWADLPDKAISIRQPWAHAIAHLGKNIENRDWATKFRGEICIHAASGGTKFDIKHEKNEIVEILEPQGIVPSFERMVKGGIIATATIVNVVNQSENPWFFGKFGFVLENIKPVEFIPCKGKLGIFNWKSGFSKARTDNV